MVFVASVGAPMGRCGEALWPMWVLAGMEGGKSRQFLNCRDSHIELKGYATSATELRDIGYRLRYIGPIALAATILPRLTLPIFAGTYIGSPPMQLGGLL